MDHFKGGRSLNGKLRDELLYGEIFYTLAEAKIVIEQWRRHYNTARSHSSLGYKPPAPEVLSWPARSTLVDKPMLNCIPLGPLSGGRSAALGSAAEGTVGVLTAAGETLS